ncbi:MAG: DSD1 family PLP-dependent enzyme [Chloroflexi bacterium]|nr:DSD1 family PLP-dependent enzyme [Chloroflexota bacterium]
MERLLGKTKEELDTPALLIDLDIMEANIAKMAGYFARLPVNLRPHTKTHKTPVIAQKQIAAGAQGITCAKVGEAEVMVAGGVKDILIANQVVGPQKIARLVDLARQANLTVAVDGERNVEDLANAAIEAGVTLKVLVEVNVGNNRCGVEPGRAAVALARKVTRSKGLLFSGLMGYEGHLVFVQDLAERKQRAEEAMGWLLQTRHLVERSGLEVQVVSGGGTGTYNITGPLPGITEVQAGSYIMMDTKYRGIEGIEFGNALSLLATVISRPTADLAITDAGMKVLTHEFGLPEVKGVPGAKLLGLAEEHGKVQLGDSRGLAAGDKIELIPSHCCTTINLHDRFLAVRNNRLEAVWDIAGRGKSQ